MIKLIPKMYTIFEALNDEQRALVDSWGKHTRAGEISGHVIPKGTHHIELPFEESDSAPQENHRVKEHLEKHGYSIHDYREGLALEPEKPAKPGFPAPKRRQVKIGAVLDKTNAPQEIKDTFREDPIRQAKSAHKQMKIVITRHPNAVAGKSTNQGWSSCMNMKDGMYRDRLKDDIEQGTHEAYLCHHDDPIENGEPKSPIARISLKPFHSNDNSHTILRPESRVYGTAPESFLHQVKQWSNRHFPMKHYRYFKDENVYNDDKGGVLYSHEYLRKSYKNAKDKESKNEILHDIFTQHPEHVTPEDHKAALHKESSTETFDAAINHPLTTEKHIDDIVNGNNYTIQKRIALGSSRATRHNLISAYQNHDNPLIKSIVARQSKTPSFILDDAIKHKNPGVRQSAYSNDNIRNYHVDHALKQETDEQTLVYAINNPSKNGLQPHHVTEILSNSEKYSDYIRQLTIQHPTAVQPEHIHIALKDVSPEVRYKAVQHPTAVQPEHITTALKDESPEVRYKAVQHPTAVQPEHITTALKDESPEVRYNAIRHPTAVQPEHITTALKDNDFDVRTYAFDVRTYAEDLQKKMNLKEFVERIIFNDYLSAKTLLESSIISIFEEKLSKRKKFLASKF